MRKFGKKASIKLASALSLGLCASILVQPAMAIQEGWYLGGGYGATHLDPKVPFGIFLVTENQSELNKVIVGYDVDQLGSLELTVSDLGEAVLSNEDTVAYSTANISGLYRIYDSQQAPYANQDWGVNLYAKLGLGYLKLESETALESESRITMVVGAGVEFAMIGGLSLRTELEFIDADALAASASLLKRFRFSKQQPENLFENAKTPQVSNQNPQENIPEKRIPKPVVPAPIVAKPSAPVPVPAPAIVERPKANPDSDADGVPNELDQCLDSKPGYPVRANGCGMLNGVLRNLQFAKYSSELTADTKASLRGLANLLKKYPQAKVQMGAHTTDDGSAASQVALTRDRIRAVGVYLATQGVSTARIKYLAYGAKVPLKGRATDRIDIKEID